ncbi:small ubiquitin-related modifier 2-A-like [Myzus persicae]|uniref:small ubiquitin-related modifier 2-A-like n=1 Tax=Myzus persicae TaxID=13164 RepID=UPI000B930DAF|nr:small ubiquitin-related modifier 2-A-like [Myzus persicae]
MTILEKKTPTNVDAPSSIMNRIICITVLSPDASRFLARVKMTTPLGRIMTAYCEINNIRETDVVFRFDGRRISSTDTALSFSIIDGDMIDAIHSN